MSDRRSVGKPSSNVEFMQRRSVNVDSMPARLNDQRKTGSRPRSVDEPRMGIRPSGGAQKEPRRPSDKLAGDYIEKREVPVQKIEELSNPFARLFHSRRGAIPGDAIGWTVTKDGIHLLHVKDGEYTGQQHHADSYETMTNKLADLKNQYRQAKMQRRELSINPTRVAKQAAQDFARKLGLPNAKVGELNRQIPVQFPEGGNGSPAATPPAATPATTTPAAAPSQPYNIESMKGTAHPVKQSFATKPMKVSGSMGPMGGGTPAESNAGPTNGGAAPTPASGGRTEVSSQDELLAAAGYSPRAIRIMSPLNKQQAIRKIKIGSPGSFKEAYPDTSFERMQPSHEARLGSGHTGAQQNPGKPDLNRDFAQFRDLDVKKVSENADREVDDMLEYAMRRLGLAEKYVGFKNLEKQLSHEKGIRNPGAVAAAMGRKKYSKNKFQSAAAHHHNMHESTEVAPLPRVRQRWV